VSALPADLVLVTKYRRVVLTDAMLAFCEQTMRTACDELYAELVEFNGEPDHIHLLVHYPPTLAIATPLQRLKTRSAYAVRREFTSAGVRARMRGHLWSPSCFAVSCRGAPLSIIKQYIDNQARPRERRATPGDKPDGQTPT
jgi:putative transposase